MMASYLRSLRVWSVSAALFLFWVPFLALIRLFDRDPQARRAGRSLRTLGRTLLNAHGAELHVFGSEHLVPGQPYVIVSNHQSIVDVLLTSFIPLDVKGLARSNLFQIPWAGWALRLSKEIPIDRKDPRNAARAMMQCAKALRAGFSVLIFAEGTRSPDGQLLPFSEGPFQIAIRERVPVLPIVLDGTGKILGKNSLLFRDLVPMHLMILPPVPTDGILTKQAPELRDLVRAKMSAALDDLRAETSDG